MPNSLEEVVFFLPGWVLVFSLYMDMAQENSVQGGYQNLRGPRGWLEYCKLEWGLSYSLAVKLVAQKFFDISR